MVYDNYSDDSSAMLLKQSPLVTLRHYDSSGFSSEDLYRDLKNKIWKESRGKADWVIICDMDEFIYHRDLLEYLHRCKYQGITIPKASGFEMFSESFPTTDKQIYDQVFWGAPSDQITTKDCTLGKFAVFNPNAVEEINYSYGAHVISPKGNIKYGENNGELKLLHFKFLGFDYLWQRYQQIAKRKNEADKKKNLGTHVLVSKQELVKRFLDCKEKAIPVF